MGGSDGCDAQVVESGEEACGRQIDVWMGCAANVQLKISLCDERRSAEVDYPFFSPEQVKVTRIDI
jgi:hypothetical protein